MCPDSQKLRSCTWSDSGVIKIERGCFCSFSLCTVHIFITVWSSFKLLKSMLSLGPILLSLQTSLPPCIPALHPQWRLSLLLLVYSTSDFDSCDQAVFVWKKSLLPSNKIRNVDRSRLFRTMNVVWVGIVFCRQRASLKLFTHTRDGARLQQSRWVVSRGRSWVASWWAVTCLCLDLKTKNKTLSYNNWKKNGKSSPYCGDVSLPWSERGARAASQWWWRLSLLLILPFSLCALISLRFLPQIQLNTGAG